MGELMRVHDWSKTRLGSPEFWPQSLRTSVSTCLNCSFPILIWWGPALVKLYNDAYRPILGAKHPRALGSAGEDVWPEIWHLIGPMLRRVMHQGEAAPAKDLLLPLRRHGYDEECYFSFSYSPIRDESGGVGGVFCPVIETTERVIGERRLHLLRAIAEYLTDLNTPAQACAAAMTCLRESGRHDFPFSAIYLIGDDPATAQLAGCAGFGPDGPACGETLRLDGTLDRTGAATPFAAVVNSSETVMAENPSELLGALPVGPWSTPAERILLIPLGDGGARPAGLMLVGLNPHRPLDEMRGFAELVAAQIAAAVAKARALVEERRRAEALAELDRAKTAFFSNISHEFRTPLTLMLGPLEEIQRKADSAPVSEVRPLAEMAIRNALRLQRLVNTLLDFSRIEAGRLHARYRPTDLARLTAELASSFHSALEQAGLRYIVDCPPLSQPVYVDGDLWEKVVLNLLSNAFKFTLHGEVRVELSEQPGAALLVVRDSGIGIAADQLPHIFDRFHRVEGTRGRSHEGTGIGLALVCDLVRLHGGEVTVASVPDQGSAFSVRIPFGNAHLPADRVSQEAVDVRADALGPAFLEEASSWLADKPGPTGTPGVYAADPRNSLDGAATILLAEDNADMRGYVRRLLEAVGYQVFAAVDGEAALEQLHAVDPDLVLTDVMMPRLDGLGLVLAIRRDPRFREVPIILLSARAGEDARITGLDAEADDYVVKPFAANELLARVRSNLATARIRRQVRDELRAFNEILEQMVAERTAERDRLWEQSEDLLVLADYDGHHLRLSPSWERVLGYSTATLLSDHYESINHPDDFPRSMAQVREMRRTGQPVRFENRILAADGTYRWISWNLSPHIGGDYIIGIGRDISGEKAARDAISEANRRLLEQIQERERVEAELRQMQRLEALGQLTSGVAHDFNNLLTVIIGALDLIERDPKFSPSDRRVRMMRSAAQRGASLTAQMLAFARKQRLNPKPIDLNTAIGGMTDLLRGTLGGTVDLEIVLKPDLWLALVDPVQLELVVLNLAINARDAMPVGGPMTIATTNVTLGAAKTPHDPDPGEYVEVCVTDAGTGMPPEILERAFEPFFTTKDVGKGSGLGLAQVYGFAKQSGGGLRIETQVGSGTSVKVYLPRAAIEPAVDSEPGLPVAAHIEGGRSRVLVVDDDIEVRDVVTSIVEGFGYHVTAAESGAAALDLLDREAPFDLLLVDFAMPGMNGVELARRVEVSKPGLPTVFITGYADVRAMSEIGTRPVVLKPFKRDSLGATLQAAIRNGERVFLSP